MRNVVLTRVDERLIHGQVMTSWLKLCNANVILIIDAGSASNAFLKRILFAAAKKLYESPERCARIQKDYQNIIRHRTYQSMLPDSVKPGDF